MIVLVGFMGSGKTTIGRALADRLGRPFIDTDRALEERRGATVAEIFGSSGEGAFRSLEAEEVGRALQGPDGVVALGGGALGDPATCAAVEWHDVVHLDVSYPEAMRRIGSDPGRPMLHRTDPRKLYDSRRPVYERVARITVDTTGMKPEEVVDRIVSDLGLGSAPASAPMVKVELGDRSYPVIVGIGIAPERAAEAVALEGVATVFFITHPSLVTASKKVADGFAVIGKTVEVLTVEEGEAAKSMQHAAKLLEELAEKGATRTDLIVSFGGGVIGDLAGFVASIYHRGMRVIHVPTSLLAQVDAAIGGKTAVNLTHGKNLAGTIHQPAAVICDVSFLRSLPDEEFRSGMAEVIKYGLIRDPSFLDLVSTSADALLAREDDALVACVRRAAAIKAAVVGADEREQGQREILNYGHTFGHAIEHLTGMRHGEAIGVGMLAAAHLAVALGMLPETAIAVHRSLLSRFGLPVAASGDPGEMLEVMKRDKKTRGSLRLVLLDSIGSAKHGVQATDDQVLAAIGQVIS